MAFIVGNSNYPEMPLQNPGHDAQDIAAQLTTLGFNVTLRQNLTRRDFMQQFNQFAQQLRPTDLALFYFSGHGIQVQNENYLLPVDAKINSQADAEFEAYSATQVRRKLEEANARVRVIILDACRTNPLFRDGRAGLAPMEAAEGTIIAFAAADNQAAADNPGERNGLFTKYLLAELKQPQQSLKDLFEQVRVDVYHASGDRQLPSLYSMLVGRVSFTNVPLPPVARPSVAAPPPAEPSPRTANMPPPAAPVKPAVKINPLLKTKVNPKDELTYVWIAPGEFKMGCSPGEKFCFLGDQDAHPVTIQKGFWLGATEVTQAAYRRVTGLSPSRYSGDNLPVEQVTWEESDHYCRAIGMRLPLEDEWEFAARGGDPSSRYGPLDDIAWYIDNSRNRTREVAQKQPNEFGLYDMLGNVWEWTANRVTRGGAMNSSKTDMRVSVRAAKPTVVRFFNMGFRCAGD